MAGRWRERCRHQGARRKRERKQHNAHVTSTTLLRQAPTHKPAHHAEHPPPWPRLHSHIYALGGGGGHQDLAASGEKLEQRFLRARCAAAPRCRAAPMRFLTPLTRYDLVCAVFLCVCVCEWIYGEGHNERLKLSVRVVSGAACFVFKRTCNRCTSLSGGELLERRSSHGATSERDEPQFISQPSTEPLHSLFDLVNVSHLCKLPLVQRSYAIRLRIRQGHSRNEFRD